MKVPYHSKALFLFYPVFLIILIPLLFTNEEVKNNNPQIIDLSIWLAFVASMIMITLCFSVIHYGRGLDPCAKCGLRKEWHKHISHDWTHIVKPKAENPDSDEDIVKGKQAGLIFATLYGLVAAIAITNALDLFMNDELTTFHSPFTEIEKNFANTDSIQDLFYLLISQEFFLLASFFVIGTLFYHCGLVFFTEEASHMLHKHRSAVRVAISSLLLFVCGIMLYFAAGVVNSLLQFSVWIWVLLIIDLVWIFFNSNTDLRGYMHWIHFDLIIFIFLLVILIGSPSQDYTNYYLYHFLILAVFLYRTVLDYKLSWKFFGQFKISG